MYVLLNLLVALKIVKRLRFTVIYKSGAKVHIKARRISWKREHGGTTFEWDDMRPQVLMFGADEIAAIWAGWK